MPPLQPTEPAEPARFSPIDSVGLLARLAGEGRLADGGVHMIGLDAIRDALGRLWCERADTVFATVESQGRCLFEPEAIIERIGETDVLIVPAAKDPLVSRGLAVRLLAQTLTQCLGEAPPSALKVKMVAGFQDGAPVCRALDLAELDEARAAADAADRAREERAADIAASLLCEPVVTFDGRRLQVEFNTQPVIDLNRAGIAGRKLEPRLVWAETGRVLQPAERMGLLAADMERVDILTLDRALERLGSEDRPASLMVTVSFLTASSQRARTRLMAHPGPLRDAVRASVIWVLTDLPDGVPPGRLTEVAALLRPFGRAVFAETRLNGVALKSARSAGIAGLIVEPKIELSSTDCALWLLQAGRLAHKCAPTLIVANLPSPDLFPMAAAAGFTHATVSET